MILIVGVFSIPVGLGSVGVMCSTMSDVSNNGRKYGCKERILEHARDLIQRELILSIVPAVFSGATQTI